MKLENSKHLYLIKSLIEQITQTLTKNSEVSRSVAHTTGFLRDTRQLFSASGELISNKTIKNFVSHQPFLNEVQSRNVQCEYISEIERVKYPERYNLDPKVYKLINAINWKIASR